MPNHRVVTQGESVGARRPTRRGFTLIELVVALGLTSIVSAALMSALLLSLRAIPAPDDGGMTGADLDAACEFLLADASLASALTVSSTKLTMTVPDVTGDAAADTVEYQLDSGTLTRAVNAGDARTLATDLASLSFTLTTDTGRVTSVNMLTKTNGGSVHRVAVECLARPSE